MIQIELKMLELAVVFKFDLFQNFSGWVVVVGHTTPSWACIAGPPTGLVNIIPATRRVAATRATTRAKHLPLTGRTVRKCR